MQVQPVSQIPKAGYNSVKNGQNPSFRHLREFYYGKSKDEILKNTINRFKKELKSYEQKENVTNYILTEHFGWHSPKQANSPKQMKGFVALSFLTVGMINVMGFLKKESDREDADELATIVIDRILGKSKLLLSRKHYT